MAALIALAMVASTTIQLLDLAARQTTTARATYDGVRALEVEGDGDVRITGAPAGAPVRVVARVTEGLRSPQRQAERDADGTLRLSSSCPAFFTGECAVRYDVSVPPGVAVVADSGAGDVTAEDLTSDAAVALQTSAGDVALDGVDAPELRLHSSAGDVVARDVGSERVEATSSAGDVRLSLRVAPRSLDVDSSAGDVEIVVPDAVYRLDADTTAGDVDTRSVRVDPDADRTIRARSSAGDVRIDARR